MIDFFDDGSDSCLEAAQYACYSEADKNGYTSQQADNCEDGSLQCENCPFEKH